MTPFRPKSKRGRKSSAPKNKTDEDAVDETEVPKQGCKFTPKKKIIKTHSTDATSNKKLQNEVLNHKCCIETHYYFLLKM